MGPVGDFLGPKESVNARFKKTYIHLDPPFGCQISAPWSGFGGFFGAQISDLWRIQATFSKYHSLSN